MFDSEAVRWRCLDCLSSSTSLAGLQIRKCPNASSKRLRHTLWRTGPFVFCAKCASYSSKRVDGLARFCLGEEVSVARCRVKERLLLGKHPVKDEFYGRPMPLSIWLARDSVEVDLDPWSDASRIALLPSLG